MFSSEIMLLISRMILVLYIANNMGVDNVGIYTTLMTWASIISLLALFGGYNIIQKEGCSQVVVSIVICLSFFLSIACSSFVAFLLFYDVVVVSVLIIASESVGLAVKSVAKSVCYSKDKVSTLAKINLYNSLCYMLGVLVVLSLDSVDIKELSIFVVIYNISTIFLYGKVVVKNVGIVKFKIPDCISYMKRSYSYLLSSSLRNLFVQIDKIVVNVAFGHSASGIYNLCSRFVTTAVLPASIYIQAIESKFYKGGHEAFYLLMKSRKNVILLSIILSVLSVPFVFFLSEFLSGLNGIFDAYLYFIPLAVSVNLAYIYMSYLNAEDNKLRIISLFFLISTVCISVFLSAYRYPDEITHVPVIISLFILFSLVLINARIKKQSTTEVDR